MHKADIKKISQKAKHLFRDAQVFVLTDPERNPDLSKNLANTTNETIIIYRSFGAYVPKLSNGDKKRVLASCSPKMALKAGILGIHIPNKNLKNHRVSSAKGLITTASAHNLREIARVANCGIKNVIVSSIFPSKSQSAGKAKGKIKLAGMIRLFPKQNFIALGGINQKSLKRLGGIKLKGIAGVSFY